MSPQEIGILVILALIVALAIWMALDLRTQPAAPKRYKPRAVKALKGDLLRPKDVSKILGIPCSTLQNMRERGTGPLWFRDGKPIYYKRADVEAWMVKRAGEALATQPPNKENLGMFFDNVENRADRQRDNSEFAT